MEQTAAYNYDVFISYSSHDEAWVRNDLLSKLEARGLRVCIDFRDFVVGVPSVKNMQRAVTTSRKTLLVLTPNYLQSAWTEFEVSMIQTLDPANRQQRIIPLRKEECQLPLEIGYLTFVDFVNPFDWEIEWRKLLNALGSAAVGTSSNGTASDNDVQRSPAIQQADETSRSAREGLEALIELMDDRQVQADVVSFEAIFETSCKQIDSLACYKDLHDLLHTLQFRCYNYLNAILHNARKSPDDLSVWDNVFEYEDTLQDIMVGLEKYTEDESLNALVPWTRGLVDNLKNLFQAITNCDPQLITLSLRPINQTLGVQPVLINTRLNEAARALPLPSLVRALTGLHEKLERALVKPRTVAKFKEGLVSLSKLHVELASLIREHDKWQEIDFELRRIEATIGQDLDELKLSWPNLKSRTEPGETVDQWAQLLRKDITKLSEALAANDFTKTKHYFVRYRSRISNRFYQVDTTLKELCSNLRRIGEPLTVLLELM